ncbi:MAG: OmpA family protein [bacterium]|nr:OmpA family protein [bacterium]
MGGRISPIALCAIGLCVGLTALPASGADDTRGLEFGLLGGLTLPDEDLSGPELSDLEASLGGRVGWVFHRNIGVYGDVLFTRYDTRTFRGDADEWSARVGGDYLFNPDRSVRWFVTGGVGFSSIEFDSATDFTSAFATAGAGQRIWVSGRMRYRWELRVDHTLAEDGLIFDDRSEDITQARFLFGLSWGPGSSVKDDDDDGVPDPKDRCDGTPLRVMVDPFGCPVDTDRDGVFDGLDVCRGTPQGSKVDSDGCRPDTDGDGVPDVEDDCAATRGGAQVDERGCRMDTDGDDVDDGADMCPDTPTGVVVSASGCPLDSDGDGSYDGIDLCSDTPVGVEVDEIGCARDDDGDGVYDGIDRCPDTPAGETVGAQGCMLPSTRIDVGETVVLEGVAFELGSETLTLEAEKALANVVEALQQVPDVRVEVGGHTDNSGSETLNRWLSTRRAEAVRAYLIDLGVDRDRLEARGYGDRQPIADNETPEGRALNRRVELKRLD